MDENLAPLVLRCAPAPPNDMDVEFLDAICLPGMYKTVSLTYGL